MKKIYFLFPIHNESKRILKVTIFFEWVKKNFYGLDYVFVFVLNDCSDNTEEVIKNNFSSYPYEIIKSDNKNRGSGLNLFYKLEKKGYFAICSIDNAWSFDFYKRAFDLIKKKKYKIVYGPKTHSESNVNTTLKRKIISFFSKIYIKILFGNLIDQDTQCIKFFDSEVPFLKELHDYNYFAETEFYLFSKKKNVSIFSIPVNVKNDTKNSKVSISSIFSFMLECLNFRFNHFKN